MKDKSLNLLSFAGVWLMAAALAADAFAQAQGSWTMKAPIPLARNEVSRRAHVFTPLSQFPDSGWAVIAEIEQKNV